MPRKNGNENNGNENDINNGTNEVYVTELQKKYMDISRRIDETASGTGKAGKYEDFARWIWAIDQLSEDFYRPDENGNLPVMDEISLNAFKDTYRRALEECDRVIFGNGDPAMKEIANEVRKVLVQDSVAFDSIEFNKDKPLTLDDIIGLGKTITADFGDQQVVSQSGQLSTRIPVKVDGAEGGDLDGYFTASTYVNPEEDKKNLLMSLSTKYPGLTPLFLEVAKMSDREMVNAGLLGLTLSEAVKKGRFGGPNPNDYPTAKKFAEAYVTTLLTDILPLQERQQVVNDKDFLKGFLEFSQEYNKLYRNNRVYINDSNHYLATKEGCNVDKRNCAMSAVSTLLGKKGLVAEAKPMIAVINGVPTAGTFMTKAFDHNLNDLDDKNPMLTADKEAYNNPAVFDDIAAMQAIDFVCGNLDRHSGNYMTRFGMVDGKLKLTGITLIDNDMSFGSNVPKKGQENKWGSRFILPEDMCAIGEETANRIMALTQEQLSMTLRGYGLSKDEIEAAWKRTEILQEAITKGKEFYKKNNIPVGEIRPQMLRVIPEKDWCKYDLDSLSPGRIRNVQKINQFYMMKSMKLQTINAYKSNKKKEADKIRDQKLRKEILGEPVPKNKKIEPLLGKPVGTGIKYTLQKTDILGIDNPEHIRLEMPGDQVFRKMAGNNNSRFPISYTGSDGRPVEGFFTAAASVNGKAQLRQLFENAISAQQGENGNPEYAEAFRRTYEYLSSGADKDRYSFSDYDLKKLGYDNETALRLRSDRVFHRIYSKLLFDAHMLPEKLKSNYIDTGADRNGTIEKRNVAMSKVGELLGTPNVLAHATTMQIKVGDKITEGVFMDRAPGIDINAIRPGDEFAKHTATAFDGSPALKDLADIQLLDYICFNHDRNVSNLLLKLSEDKTKVIGITGIDNDNSFGTIRLAPDKRHFMEPTLDSITVASERMAEKIRVMTTNGLVHTLEGQGLTKKEIYAAVDRFSVVKERIESGQIRVVKDEEWENMKLSELADNDKSLFSGVNKAFAIMMPENLREMDPNKPVEVPVFAHGNKVDKFSPEAVQKAELDEKIQKKQDEMLKDFREELRIAKSERSLNDTELLKKVTYYANVFKEKVDEGTSIFHKAS
ncbi:MAG: hypothetical protein J6Y89_09095, partial [Lachnospiraceae bacterium]|nr:hypothetical protein [Lachnospiraceae bacterium]